MTDSIKPITPDEVGAYKAQIFPDYVFQAFNDCIAEKAVNGRAKVKQDDVIARMMQLGLPNGNDANDRTNFRAQIFARGYLNVEDAYRAVGWKVTYDKPAYNETYDASFEFKRKIDD